MITQTKTTARDPETEENERLPNNSIDPLDPLCDNGCTYNYDDHGDRHLFHNLENTTPALSRRGFVF